MVVRDASTGVGAEIVQYGEIGSDNAIWILEYSTLDTKYFRLKNKIVENTWAFSRFKAE